LVCAIPTVLYAPSSSQTVELGDELDQLRRLADEIEARFQRAQKEKKATKALKKEKDTKS
jgi:hypothetical protein